MTPPAPETVEREVQARTVAGFVAAYGIGVTTTYALIGAGKLRTVKVGRRTLIVEASARAWFDGLQATTEKVSAQSHKLPHKWCAGLPRTATKAGERTE